MVTLLYNRENGSDLRMNILKNPRHSGVLVMSTVGEADKIQQSYTNLYQLKIHPVL